MICHESVRLWVLPRCGRSDHEGIEAIFNTNTTIVYIVRCFDENSHNKYLIEQRVEKQPYLHSDIMLI